MLCFSGVGHVSCPECCGLLRPHRFFTSSVATASCRPCNVLWLIRVDASPLGPTVAFTLFGRPP